MEEDFSKWTVPYLKELLLQYDIDTRYIKGSGKNGNMIKKDYIKLSKQYVKNQIDNMEIPFNNDIIFEIGLNLNYFTLLDLCSTNKNYNALCKNQHFWEVKYKKDFDVYNMERYLKESEYTKKWFPKDLMTFEEYNLERFEEAEDWKPLYEQDMYYKIEDLVNIIFNRFGIREKYDRHYNERKDNMVNKILIYIKNSLTGINQNDKILSHIKNILGNDYKDFNYYATFFGENPKDDDTAYEFILRIATKGLSFF